MHTFHVDGLEHAFRVVRFSGYEAISRPFQLDVTVICDERDVAPGVVVGKRAALGIHAGGETRTIHGIVRRFAHGDPGRTHTEYRISLVPAMWKMQLGRTSRIFQGLTVPEILVAVFEGAGFLRVDRRRDDRRHGTPDGSFRLALGGAYRPRAVCVQYRESDWDFANRLMEEEGIHYFFEHDDGAHVLVATDAPMSHEPIAGADAIAFRTPAGAMSPGEHVSRFHFAEEVRPGKVALDDYCFERPMLPLDASAEVEGGGEGEVYEHPGDYDLPTTGAHLSRVRLEELQAARWTAEGETGAGRLAPGRTFALTDHPCADFNRGYLITRIEHRGAEAHADGGSGDERYACRFEVMPAGVPFRPPRATPRPTIHGVQTAIVVGPPGEEIHTDEHGRVKVRFHWDRTGLGDDRCSCWIRVAQASAGAAWGSVFIPRVGHEVIVDFIEGDPDRPLVTGSVYHGANVPPYPLPAEKTKSTLKTRSTPGGDAGNELRFEDRKGAEEVYLHAQKDLEIAVENDKDQSVGGDESLAVSGNRTVSVNGLHTETVLLAQTVTVGAALTQTVGAMMTTAVAGAKLETVGLASAELVAGKKTTRVGLSYSAKAGTDVSVRSGRNTAIMAGGHLSEQAARNVTVTAGNEVTVSAEKGGMSLSAKRALRAKAGGMVGIEAGMGMSVVVDGNVKERATKTRTMIVGDHLTIRFENGSSEITIDKTGKIDIKGDDITVTAKGGVKVKAAGNVKINGGKVDING